MHLNCRLWNKGPALILTLFGLLGGAHAQQTEQGGVIAYESLSRSVYVERCDRDRCARLDWQTLKFQGQPELNRFIDRALWALLQNNAQAPKPEMDLPALTEHFQAQAKPGEQIVLQTSLLRQTSQWVVLSLSKYQFEGGAHGLSSARFINWRLADDRAVTLADALQPDAQAAYVDALKRAHKQWVVDQKSEGSIKNVSDFIEQWPFVPSENVAFMAEGLHVGYARYAIAPGSFGEPVLTVPYAALAGVIKPGLLESLF